MHKLLWGWPPALGAQHLLNLALVAVHRTIVSHYLTWATILSIASRWKKARLTLKDPKQACQAARPHRLVCAGKLMQQLDVRQAVHHTASAEAVWCAAYFTWGKQMKDVHASVARCSAYWPAMDWVCHGLSLPRVCGGVDYVGSLRATLTYSSISVRSAS